MFCLQKWDKSALFWLNLLLLTTFRCTFICLSMVSDLNCFLHCLHSNYRWRSDFLGWLLGSKGWPFCCLEAFGHFLTCRRRLSCRILRVQKPQFLKARRCLSQFTSFFSSCLLRFRGWMRLLKDGRSGSWKNGSWVVSIFKPNIKKFSKLNYLPFNLGLINLWRNSPFNQ